MGGGGSIRNTPAPSCYSNQVKHWPDGPHGSYADSTSSSELLFAPCLEQTLVQNISHENDLIKFSRE